LLQIHVMKDVKGSGLLGISMWDSEKSFDRAMQAVSTDSASVAKNRALVETPTIVRQFTDV
jgi:hypothetical protein